MTLAARSLTRILLVNGSERTVLRDVSFELDGGTILGVTGPKGSGKSSLLRALLGLDARSGGDVLLDGVAVAPERLPELRRNVVFVPPAGASALGATPAASFEQAAEYRGRAAAPDALARALEETGLGGDVAASGWTALAPSDRLFALLALVAALEPRFLVLDDPLGAGLRSEGRRLRMWLRAQAGRGRGVLVASPDEDFLALVADRLMILFDGEVHAHGPTEELIPGVVQAARRRERR